MFALISRLRSALGGAIASGFSRQVRVNHNGELIVSALRPDQLALEGSYFVTVGSAPGVGIAVTAANSASFAVTTPAFLIRNTETNLVTGSDSVVKRLKLIVVAVGTGVTNFNISCVTDSVNRHSSGGTLLTPRPALASNPDAAITSISVVATANAVVSTTRTVGRAVLKNAALVVGDTITINFGGELPESTSLTGTTSSNFSVNLPAMVVPPGGTGLIYLWGTGMTGAPTFEVTFEHYER